MKKLVVTALVALACSLPGNSQFGVTPPPCAHQDIDFTTFGVITLHQVNKEEAWITIKNKREEQQGFLYSYRQKATQILINGEATTFYAIKTLPPNGFHVRIKGGIDHGCGVEVMNISEVRISTRGPLPPDKDWIAIFGCSTLGVLTASVLFGAWRNIQRRKT